MTVLTSTGTAYSDSSATAMRCNFTQENFLHFANQTLISETVHAAPSQKCISDWDLGLARKIHSDIARTHSPILQWDVNSKSPKHGLDF